MVGSRGYTGVYATHFPDAPWKREARVLENMNFNPQLNPQTLTVFSPSLVYRMVAYPRHGW